MQRYLPKKKRYNAKGFINNAKGKMKSTLIGPAFKESRLIKTYTQDFENETYKEVTETIDRNGITGTSKEIQLNGIHLELRDVTVEKDYIIDVSHDFPLFKLHFEIQGSNHYKPSNTLSKELYIESGHYNLFYFPQVNGQLIFKTKRRKTLEIKFTEAYIKRIIGKDFKQSLVDFGEKLSKKQPFVLWENSQPISLELQDFISHIYNCKYTGNIKKAYLEAKIMEMLIVLLASTNDKKTVNEPTKADKQKITLLESYIRKNLDKNITISELSTIAGLNTSKLKQSFKSMYSTTIFKYITDLKMQKAIVLIRNKQLPIAQVAFEVGYKNPQHFTVAFKKKFGVLPKDVCKSKIIF